MSRDSFEIRCGFCRQKNRVLYTRITDAKCGACKVTLAEVIADMILATQRLARRHDLKEFLEESQRQLEAELKKDRLG